MRILLLSMPDSFEHTSTITMRMPNGELMSVSPATGLRTGTAVSVCRYRSICARAM